MAQIWQEFTDAIKWDRWARAQTDSNFLLAWNWGQAQKDQGYTIRRRGLVDDRGRIKGAYTATTIKARRGRYMTIEGGPQIKYDDESVWQSFIDDVRTIGQAAGAVFIRVRPPLDLNEKNQRIFRDAGWKPAPIHLGAERIGWLDLTQSDQQLWANMSQSRRRQIRRSQKADITISRHQTLAVALEFARIHRQHSVRQEYIAFSQRKLTKQFAAFAQADQAVIYKASHQETVLALNMSSFSAIRPPTITVSVRLPTTDSRRPPYSTLKPSPTAVAAAIRSIIFGESLLLTRPTIVFSEFLSLSVA